MDAFVSLFFEQSYDRITVGAICRRAAVGRSTFYEHFVDKEDVLGATVRKPLEGLASSVEPGRHVTATRRAVAHFWENRERARSLLGSSARGPITRLLAALITQRLRERPVVETVAVAIAEAHIGTIVAALRGETDGNVDVIASVLHRLAQAMAS